MMLCPFEMAIERQMWMDMCSSELGGYQWLKHLVTLTTKVDTLRKKSCLVFKVRMVTVAFHCFREWDCFF